ncbi:MAG: LysR family transcriptional regulator [Flavobacteriales bacterium]|nr:LysR family transcriptional regulator [Flavobacteriales bacterium]
MEIKYFKLVKTIVEEGSLANSSEKLFLTQSALSHQLKELELLLGFKVFNRKRNKWQLTEEGEEFYKLGNQVLQNIEVGISKINQIQQGTSGTIRVSCECYSFYHGFSKFIQQMGILYPEIQIDLILEATHHPIPKILSHEIDIAIVTQKPIDSTLTSIPFFEDEIIALVHKENNLNQIGTITAKDLAKEHLLIHSFPLETVSVYEQYLKLEKLQPRKTTAIPLTQVALEMVNANMGIMCVPLWTLKSFNLPENLIVKKIDKNGVKRNHYLVLRKVDSQQKHFSNFIESFKEFFKIK